MAAFKNRKAAKRIAREPCAMCGNAHVPRDACHLIDEVREHGGEEAWNAISLCPNCHKIFDERLRPKLYQALERHGATGLPASWRKSNKLTLVETASSDEESEPE